MRHDLERELRQHATALRGLARDLVGESHADDVLQETALQALVAPPRRSGPLGGWLYGVVRHLAFRHQRGERRRRRRELAVARSEVQPADTSVEDEDALRRLTDAVLSLPEAYRRAVFLRYLRDLTPGEIATESGEPAETIKSRLHRGLALLRERLERDGQGNRWRAAFQAAFGLQKFAPSTATALAGTGVLLMGTGLKFAIGGVAAALAVAATLWFTGDGPVVPSGGNGAGSAAPVSIVAEAAEPAAVTERREEAPLPVAAEAGPVLATLRGRCVDAWQQPLAGVEALLAGDAVNRERLDAWLENHPRPEPVRQRLITDREGRFEFRFVSLPPLTWRASLNAPDGVALEAGWWIELASESVTDVGDVVVPHGVSVRGRVHDPDGAPLREAAVYGFGPPRDQKPGVFLPRNGFAAKTQADGAFEVRLLPGEYSVRVPGEVIASGERFTVPEDVATHTVEVVLENSGFVSFAATVTDEGEVPIPGVFVDGGGTFTVSTDRDGRFRLKARPRADGRIALRLRKPGYEDFEAVPLVSARDPRFALRSMLTVEVRVVAAAGSTPVEDYAVRVIPRNNSGAPGMDPDISVKSRGQHQGGVALVTGIARGPAYVFVQPRDPALAASTMVPVEVAVPSPVRVQVQLPRLAQRVVRVQRADGTPVAGTRLQLVDPLVSVPLDPRMKGAVANESRPPQPVQRWFCVHGQRPDLLLHEATTDAEGACTLRGPAGLQLALLALGPGHAPLRFTDVHLDVAEPLVVKVSSGARLECRVTPPAGVRDLLADAVPAKEAVKPRFGSRLNGGFRLQQADGHAIPAEAAPPVLPAADGTFALDGVPPGVWQLWLTSVSGNGANGRVVADVTLRDGETTRVEVDTTAWIRGELAGTVLHNGEPLALQAVELRYDLGAGVDGSMIEGSETVSTDAAGRFQVRIRHGTCRLAWERRDGGPLRLRAREEVSVPAGGRVVQTFHLDSGVLRVRLLTSDGQPKTGVALQLLDALGKLRQDMPATDQDGFTQREVEGEPLTVCVLPRHLQAAEAQREFSAAARAAGQPDPLPGARRVLGSVTVRPAQTTASELRLAADWDR